MAKFKYAAIGPDGSTIHGVAEADTQGGLAAVLGERHLALVDAKEKRSFLDIEITRSRVPRKDVMHFSRQIATFLRAGIPIVDAIDVIRQETTQKVFARVLGDIVDRLRAGETLTSCVESHPEAFPQFYVGIVRSAELTGNLDTVMDQLAAYIDRDLEARRKVVSALVYPGLVMVMSIVAVVVITVYVLPKFETFFASFKAKLPLPTRMLMSFSHFIGSWWMVVFGTIAALIVAAYMASKTSAGKAKRDALMLKLPVVGDIVRYSILERFCRILSAMVQAGVALPDALAVTTQSLTNAVYSRGLGLAREAMVRGEGLAMPLASTGLFPAAARQMFRVGEDTGTLDDQMETAAIYFDRELDYKIKRFTQLFEPAVVIFMGAVVGFVAIALISAMYGIFRQVNVP